LQIPQKKRPPSSSANMEKSATDQFIEETTKPLTSHRNTTPFTITFQDLSVYVPAVKPCLPCCTFRNIKAFGAEHLGFPLTEREGFATLDRVSGQVKSGETLLVLGSSGSGKSTLLRALCGRLNETDDLSGTVSLNGMPIGKSNQSWRRMCSYVSPDDGTHSPVLTVGETFRFAAQCTSDGKTNDTTLETRVDWMLEALGLSHVKNTVVGDENLRGVSGGQKRRVTVGEMLLNPHSRVFCEFGLFYRGTCRIELCSHAFPT
jgi:ABC-type glutathione transport system ATPase component